MDDCPSQLQNISVKALAQQNELVRIEAIRQVGCAYDILQSRLVQNQSKALGLRIPQAHLAVVDFPGVDGMNFPGPQVDLMGFSNKFHRSAETNQNVIIPVGVGKTVKLV